MKTNQTPQRRNARCPLAIPFFRPRLKIFNLSLKLARHTIVRQQKKDFKSFRMVFLKDSQQIQENGKNSERQPHVKSVLKKGRYFD